MEVLDLGYLQSLHPPKICTYVVYASSVYYSTSKAGTLIYSVLSPPASLQTPPLYCLIF